MWYCNCNFYNLLSMKKKRVSKLIFLSKTISLNFAQVCSNLLEFAHIHCVNCVSLERSKVGSPVIWGLLLFSKLLPAEMYQRCHRWCWWLLVTVGFAFSFLLKNTKTETFLSHKNILFSHPNLELYYLKVMLTLNSSKFNLQKYICICGFFLSGYTLQK